MERDADGNLAGTGFPHLSPMHDTATSALPRGQAHAPAWRLSRLPSRLPAQLLPALQVPKRTYSLAELRLNKIQPEQFLAPSDSTLSGVRNLLQGGFLAGLTAAYFGHVVDLTQIVQARGVAPV